MNCLVNETLTDIGCIPSTPGGLTQKLYEFGLGVIGGLGFIGMVYAFFLILTSKGNVIQMEKGKRYFYSSIAGILLVVFAIFLTKLFAINILHLPGFSP